MLTKTMTALAATLLLSATSVALASNEHDESVSDAQAAREANENLLPWWWTASPHDRSSFSNGGNALGFVASPIRPESGRKGHKR
jgi:Spy/CpxP family protein refolding chaperone